MSGAIDRRSLIAAAAGVPLLAGCAAASAHPASPRARTHRPTGVQRVQGTLTTPRWPGRQVRWQVARPVGVERPRLVVALHGHGGNASSAFHDVHLDRQVASTGLAVASVDGGDHYWHARRSGIDTAAMVVEDLLPLLARQGLRTDRFGLLGWSMGGYGSLLLATRLGPARVAAVVTESTALWLSPGRSDPGAFDDRADFVAHDVFRLRSRLHGIPVHLSCGLQDRFLRANRAFARGLPGVVARFTPGGHSVAYWSAQAPTQMAWLRGHLPD